MLAYFQITVSHNTHDAFDGGTSRIKPFGSFWNKETMSSSLSSSSVHSAQTDRLPKRRLPRANTTNTIALVIL